MVVLGGGRIIGVLPVGIHGVRVRVHGIVVIVIIVRAVISAKVERILPLIVVVLVI